MAKLIAQPGRRTVNERVLRRSLARALYLERFKKHEVAKVLAFIDDEVLPDLGQRIETGLERVASRGLGVTERRLKGLRTTMSRHQQAAVEGFARASELLKTDLRELAVLEAGWQAGALGTETAGLAVSFTEPAVPTLRALVSRISMHGHLLDDWWKQLGQNVQRRVTEQVRIGLAEGESVGKIVTRLRGTEAARFKDGVFAATRREATTLVRTAATTVSSAARELTYEENSDLIEGVLWVSTLDTRTSAVCRALDGRVFEPGKGPRPPAHPNCRSTTTPVLKSWKQLGLKLPDLPEGTRASMNGQVPASLTYNDWLREQSEAVQDKVLGPSRAKLFRSGRFDVRDMVSASTRKPLTLAQLARKR